jgi:hypothetical protein
MMAIINMRHALRHEELADFGATFIRHRMLRIHLPHEVINHVDQV